tara:strand:+ start:23399 stop:24010 length:612 start_codon:yes stop_codon:yes gene_type:complete
MLRLTVRPETLYFEDNFQLYAHMLSGSTTYINSFMKIVDIHTIADFWNTYNSLPSAKDLHSSTINVAGKKMVAYSLFKNNITPEWEHPINKKGSEWGCRENLSCETFAETWRTLSLSFVNNELDHVVGVRCINKSNRNRVIHKIEVWMDTVDTELCMSVKDVLLNLIPDCPYFTLMQHEYKQHQANEYNKTKKNHKKERGILR